MRLHFQQFGEGPPLVIIHGLFGEGENWRTMAQRLGGIARVYTVDLRNHGSSPHSYEVSLRVMAADVVELMDALSLDRTAMLGHSLGGKIAMQLAADSPERVEKLIVIDVGPRTTGGAFSGIILETLHGLDPRRFRSRREIDEALAATIPDQRARLFLMKDLERAEEGTFRWRIGIAELFHNRLELRREVDIREPFEVPALFIMGSESEYAGSGILADIRGSFPRARIVTIPKAGHWVHVDAPGEFERTVSSFLATSSEPAALTE